MLPSVQMAAAYETLTHITERASQATVPSPPCNESTKTLTMSLKALQCEQESLKQKLINDERLKNQGNDATREHEASHMTEMAGSYETRRASVKPIAPSPCTASCEASCDASCRAACDASAEPCAVRVLREEDAGHLLSRADASPQPAAEEEAGSSLGADVRHS